MLRGIALAHVAQAANDLTATPGAATNGRERFRHPGGFAVCLFIQMVAERRVVGDGSQWLGQFMG